MCRTLGWARGCSLEHPPRGMLLVLTNVSPAEHKTHPARRCPPPNSLVSLQTRSRRLQISHMGSGAEHRHTHALTHSPAFVPVFRQDGNLWERLPPCVRLGGTTGHSLFSSQDGFRADLATQPPAQKSGLGSVTQQPRLDGPCASTQGENCFSKAPGCEKRSLGGGIPICPMTSGP